MKVYIVVDAGWGDDGSINSVWDSEEKARKYISTLKTPVDLEVYDFNSPNKNGKRLT